MEVEVIAIDAKKEAGEDCKVAGIGNVHNDQEKDRVLEKRVVHQKYHGSYLDQKFAKAVPVRRAGHEVLGKGIPAVVVHGVKGTDH